MPATRCQSRHKTGREASISTHCVYGFLSLGLLRSAWLGDSSCPFQNLKPFCISYHPAHRCYRLPLVGNKQPHQFGCLLGSIQRYVHCILTHKQCQSEGQVNAQDIQLEKTSYPGIQMSFVPGPDTGKSPHSIHSSGLQISHTQCLSYCLRYNPWHLERPRYSGDYSVTSQ